MGRELLQYPWVSSSKKILNWWISHWVFFYGQSIRYILSPSGRGEKKGNTLPCTHCQTYEATTDIHAWRRKCSIMSSFSFRITSSWDCGWPLGPWPSWMWLTCVISRLVGENQRNCYQNNYIQGHQNNGLSAPRDLETILALPRMPSGTVAKSDHLFVSSFPPGKLKLFLLLPVSKYIIKMNLDNRDENIEGFVWGGEVVVVVVERHSLNRWFCKRKPFDLQPAIWSFQINLIHMCWD